MLRRTARCPASGRERFGFPAMRAAHLALAMLAPLCPGIRLADASEARWGYRGVWAGERMLCDAPDAQLHVYGLTHLRHPVLYEGDAGYACKIVSIEGRRPVWALRLKCTTFGIGHSPRQLDATQTLTLLEGGTKLAVDMKAKHGGVAWSDELLRCRSLNQRQRRPTPQKKDNS